MKQKIYDCIKDLADKYQVINDRAGTTYEYKVSGMILSDLKAIIQKYGSAEAAPRSKNYEN